MRRIGRGRVVVALGALALVLGVWISSSQAKPRVATPSASPSESPTPSASPSILPPTDLSAEERHSDGGFILEPPGGQEPSVSSDSALTVAFNEAGMPAVSVQPILALLPAGGTFVNDTLVWDLRYSNACIPVHGGVDYSGPHQSCGQDWDVLVDATTGEFIDAFSTEASA